MRLVSRFRCIGIFASLLLLVGFTGCSAETPPEQNGNCTGSGCPGDEDGEESEDDSECQIRTDCDVGQVCRDGRCVEDSECGSDDACPDGEICKRGNCFPDLENRDTETTDSTRRDVFDGSDTSEDVAGCQGCFLTAAEATCVDGASPTNCGEGGSVCESCSGEQICTTDGECKAPPSCSPQSCDGCCKDGECKDGTAKAACGTGGAQCETCDIEGQTCEDGSCTAPCSSQSCPNGCCNADGECKTVQNASYCGTGGTSCKSCAENETCESGECVELSCRQSCQGCCRDGNCLSGQGADACGELGESCRDCTPGRSCSDNDCRVNSGSNWDFQILSADVPLKNASGDYWDSFGGTVDPYIEVAAQNGSTVYEGETTHKEDQANPRWPGGTVLSNIPVSALLETDISVSIYDDDGAFNPDDTVVKCQLNFSDIVFNEERFERTCTPNDPTTEQVEVKLGLKLKHR